MDIWFLIVLLVLLNVAIWYFVLSGVWLKIYFKPKNVARRIIKGRQLFVSEKIEYAPADPASFSWVDRDFYYAVTEFMAGAGFRCLGDYENLTVSKANPESRVYQRFFLSSDGLACGSCYHLQLRNWTAELIRKYRPDHSDILDHKICEFGTEFEGGVFLCTTNAKLAGCLTQVPGIHYDFLAEEMPWRDILSRHLESMRNMIEEQKLDPVKMESIEDLIASGNREQAIKAAFRKKNGVATGDEIRRIAETTNATSQITEEIARHVNAMSEAERRKRQRGDV